MYINRMRNWYAVYTKPTQEQKACDSLRAFGFEIFYPRLKVRKIRKRQGKPITLWVIRPYFPRYLFVNTTKQQLSLVRRCRFVSAIVAFGEHPTAIPALVMDVLKAGADEDGLMGSKDQVARARFKAMQSIKFNENSPLRDTLAKVSQDDGGDTIRVLLNLLGSEREIIVPANIVEAA